LTLRTHFSRTDVLARTSQTLISYTRNFILGQTFETASISFLQRTIFHAFWLGEAWSSWALDFFCLACRTRRTISEGTDWLAGTAIAFFSCYRDLKLLQALEATFILPSQGAIFHTFWYWEAWFSHALHFFAHTHLTLRTKGESTDINALTSVTFLS
jgi:hypothetical protein